MVMHLRSLFRIRINVNDSSVAEISKHLARRIIQMNEFRIKCLLKKRAGNVGARTRRRFIFLMRSKKIEYLLSYRFHKF